MPFTCSYCGQTFCSEHRLPEKHQCPALPSIKRSRGWGEKAVSSSGSSQPKKVAPVHEPVPFLSKVSIKFDNFRRRYLNRYRVQGFSRGLRRYGMLTVGVTVIVVSSLPLYLAYLIDLQVSKDPFTGILLRDFVNQNVLIPAGVYLASVIYLIYRRMSHYRLKFEWVLVGVSSLVATWYISRFLNTMSALSMIFQSSQPELPGFLGFYEIWVHQLTSNLVTATMIIQSRIMRLLGSVREYINNLYHEVTG